MASTVNAQKADPIEIGQRLAHLRAKRGLSQRQLAGDGCNSAYISVLEKGGRTPSLDTLQYLAERLGTSARYLATGDLEPWQLGLDEAGIEIGDLDEHERAVLARSLDDAAWHAARVVAEAIVENRVEQARALFRTGETAIDAAGATRAPLQTLVDALTREDHDAHDAMAAALREIADEEATS